MRLSVRWAPLLTAILMSFFMVMIITAALSLIGEHPSLADWMHSFVRVWPVAFAAVLAVLPLVRRLVAAMTQPRAGAGRRTPGVTRSIAVLRDSGPSASPFQPMVPDLVMGGVIGHDMPRSELQFLQEGPAYGRELMPRAVKDGDIPCRHCRVQAERDDAPATGLG